MISVIMSTYKESVEYINKAIQSILRQTYADIELIIVVDDPDNIDAINLIENLAQDDSRIKLLINEENKGLVFSLNRALLKANGKYIARMDADDFSHIDRLETEIKHLELHNYDLVGSFTDYINMDGIKSGGGFQDVTIADNLPKLLKYENCVPHPTWLAKKELYDFLKGYRQIPYSEDYDFLLRAMQHGASLSIIKKTLLDYRINDNGISKLNSYKQALATNYLSSNRHIINQITSEDVINIINKYDNETQERRYFIGMEKLKSASNSLKDGKYFEALGNMIYSYFVSHVSRHKLLNLLRKYITAWR